MTTTVKIHVNGNYRATVRVRDGNGNPSTFSIDGDASGGRERSLPFMHGGGENEYVVSEEPLTDEMKAARPAEAN